MLLYPFVPYNYGNVVRLYVQNGNAVVRQAHSQFGDLALEARAKCMSEADFLHTCSYSVHFNQICVSGELEEKFPDVYTFELVGFL